MSISRTGTFVPRSNDIVIGREPACDIVLSSRYVNRRHARIHFDGKYWWLEDLRSVNGTLLDGVKVQSPEKLKPGDWIRIGEHDLTFIPRWQGNEYYGPEDPWPGHEDSEEPPA